MNPYQFPSPGKGPTSRGLSDIPDSISSYNDTPRRRSHVVYRPSGNVPFPTVRKVAALAPRAARALLNFLLLFLGRAWHLLRTGTYRVTHTPVVGSSRESPRQ